MFKTFIEMPWDTAHIYSSNGYWWYTLGARITGWILCITDLENAIGREPWVSWEKLVFICFCMFLYVFINQPNKPKGLSGKEMCLKGIGCTGCPNGYIGWLVTGLWGHQPVEPENSGGAMIRNEWRGMPFSHGEMLTRLNNYSNYCSLWLDPCNPTVLLQLLSQQISTVASYEVVMFVVSCGANHVTVLGESPATGEVFEVFEEKPLGSASIAQVEQPRPVVE